MSEIIIKFKSLALVQSELTKEQLALKAQWESISKTGQILNMLDKLNLHLRDNAFLVGTLNPTELDVSVFEAVFPVLKDLLSSSKDVKNYYVQYRHILRWISYLQKLLELPLEKQIHLNLDIDLPREVIEKKKKEEKKSEAAPTSQKNKSKKDNQQRGKPDEETLKKLREEAKIKKAAKKVSAPTQSQDLPQKPKVSSIDFRVGFIQKAIKHPDADSLYVSTIDVGDEEGPRTVCSGLVKYYPLEAMQERYVVAVCNLKPVNMRGIKSTAMVLCGSDDTKVEFVQPPCGSKPGDKVFFEGFSDENPLNQLNPKKKIWEQLQPHFTTNDQLEVVFQDDEDTEQSIRKLVNLKGETFKVNTITGANVR